MTTSRTVKQLPFLNFLFWSTPRGGWITAFLLLVSLEAVVWSVEAANWGTTPNLGFLMVVAVAFGIVGADRIRSAPISHMAALGVGVAIVYWRTAGLSDAQGWTEKFIELNQRMSRFWDAASGGGIGTDITPFLLGLGVLTWFTGYISAWVIFRYQNFWVGILPGTLAITTHLSYLPDRFLPYLYLYLFFTMLLAVRLRTLGQEKEWGRNGVQVEAASNNTQTLHATTWFLGAIFLLGMVLPTSSMTVSAFKDSWNTIRWPAQRAEVEFSRLFSSLPAREAKGVQTFGDYLPFQGPISLGEQVIFTVDSPTPAYWRSRTYPIYTHQGWKSDEAEVYPFTSVPELNQPREGIDGTALRYTVTLAVKTTSLPLTGIPLEISEPAEIRVQPTRSFYIRLDQPPSSSVPDDIEEAWQTLTALGEDAQNQQAFASTLLMAFPEDIVFTRLRYLEKSGSRTRLTLPIDPLISYPERLKKVMSGRTGKLVGLWVTRVPPMPPDILQIRANSKLEAGAHYSVTSSATISSPELLRVSGSEYPGWITDTYLQLPATFPQQLVSLAKNLTANASNPYDKAIAIQSYLKTFPYDQKIPPPPFNADGVEYFLFTAKRGYSDYFGSAMATLLRAVDVPTRLVVGHAPGNLDKVTGAYVIRDRDSHGWPEVYFPSIGWVEFEPTPGFHIPGPEEAYSDQIIPDAYEEEEDEEELSESELLGMLGASAKDNQGGFLAAILRSGQSGLLAGMTLVSISLVVAFVLSFLYRRYLVRVSVPHGAYMRMSTLASLAGTRPLVSQTPEEFARSLAHRYPEVGSDLQRIVELYARIRYGVIKDAHPDEVASMRQAWRRVRRHLLSKVFRRYLLFWVPTRTELHTDSQDS
jgi:transglutaminase-like putative cysteine protease